MHRVIPQLLGLPGADITDLPMGVVVPPLAGHRIGDGFAELVRTGGGQSVQVCHPAQAASAIWKGHHGVADAASESVVIATERLAGTRSTLHHRSSWRKVNEIESVSVGLRNGGVAADLLLQCLLNRRI